MRALVLQDFWQMGVEEREDPVPGQGEVLIRITATGICGSDVHGFTGENGRRRPGQVMGHETVGRIESTAPDVTGLAPGTVVTVNPVVGCGRCVTCVSGRAQSCPDKALIGVHADVSSAFAQLMVAPADNVVPLPDAMPEEYGTLAEPLSVGLHAVRRGDCRADDTVLVLGGGPIGQACVLAAHRQGARRIVVSEPDHRRHDLLFRLGATVFDPTEDDLPGRVSRALGQQPTLVLDAVGCTASLADALACSAPCARIVFVGMATPRVELDAYGISVDERSLIGSFCYTGEEFRETARWVGTAPDILGRLIEGRVGLDGGPDAFTEIAKGHGSAGKVLVFPNTAPRS